jgi:hypothetical protein
VALKFKHPSIYLATYKMMKISIFLFFFWVGEGDLATKTTPQTLHFGVEKSRFNRKKFLIIIFLNINI